MAQHCIDPRTTAAEKILQSLAADDGRFREVQELTLWCELCPGRRRRIARFFVGRDELGLLRDWVMALGATTAHDQRPAWKAQRSMAAGEDGARPMGALCPRCKAGWLLFPAGLDDELQRVRDSGQLPVWVTVLPDDDTPDVVGKPYSLHEITEWADGPGSIVRARIGPPQFGHLAQ